MKILKFEFSRLFKGKIFFSVLIALFVSFMAFLLLFRVFNDFSINIDPETDYIQIYKNELSYIDKNLNGTLDEETRTYLEGQKNKYEFYIENNKNEFEYLRINDFTQMTVNSGSSFMVFCAYTSFLFMLIMSVILSIYSIGVEVSSGSVKNILHSKIQVKRVFMGKILFQWIILSIFSFILNGIALVSGIQNADAEFLTVINGNYSSVNCIISMILQIFSFSFIVFFLSLTLNYLIIAYKDLKAVLTSFIVGLIIMLLCCLLYISPNDSTVISIKYVPVFNLIYFTKILSIWSLIATIVYITFFGLLFILVKNKSVVYDL